MDSPVEICGMFNDIVKSANKFVRQNIPCAVIGPSNIAHRDKVKNYFFTVMPSTNKCLLFLKVNIPIIHFQACFSF